MKPSTGAAVRDHRNAVRDRSESLSAFNRNRCPQSSESAGVAAGLSKVHFRDRHHIAKAMAELVSYLSIIPHMRCSTFLRLQPPAPAGAFFRRSTSCVETRRRAQDGTMSRHREPSPASRICLAKEERRELSTIGKPRPARAGLFLQPSPARPSAPAIACQYQQPKHLHTRVRFARRPHPTPP